MTRIEAKAAAIQGPRWLESVRAYIALTKPVIISLLLVTTVPAMVAADRGWPGTWVVIATLIGGTASAGGANVINCWYDRDIDRVMRRTRKRPLVTGAVTPAKALTFGIVLGAGSFVFLWLTTTPMAAVISLVALLFYVFIYTMWLKRRTAQNIVIGGAAGAFPPMVGWAAVTGDVSVASVVMFLLIFMWTPPHFWALSLKLKDDYAEAGVPMLPVTAGPAETRRQILIYSWILAGVAVALIPVAHLHYTYGTTAIGGSGLFIWYAWQLYKKPAETSPMSLYKYSLLYLALLFVAIGGDAAVYH